MLIPIVFCDCLQVCVYNRTVEKVDEFLKNEAKDSKVIGAHSLEEMVRKLKRPRKVMLMVKAGQAVDEFIGKLVCWFVILLKLFYFNSIHFTLIKY